MRTEGESRLPGFLGESDLLHGCAPYDVMLRAAHDARLAGGLVTLEKAEVIRYTPTTHGWRKYSERGDGVRRITAPFGADDSYRLPSW